jgi:hypothetical protein
MILESKTTILFEDPFWIGIFERTYCGEYQVFRHVFGPEPKNYEVYEFILANYNDFRYSQAIPADEKKEKKVNPKRQRKKISKELENVQVGTKAQIAMKLQHEQNKVSRKTFSKQQKEEMKKMKFDLKQKKKKEKHRGH